MTPIRRIACATNAWVLGWLLLSSPAWAQDFTVYPEDGSQEFLGLDDTSAPTAVQDGRATDLQNVKLDISKSLQKRFGYSVVGDTLDVGSVGQAADEDECVVTGLYHTRFSSGTERNIATCGSRFSFLNGSDWQTVSGPTVVQTAGQNNQFVWTTALDEIIGTNGVDVPIRYNGTSLNQLSLTSLSSANRPSRAKTLAFFKNFLILANTTEGGVAYPTRFRWSHVGSTSTWSDDDYVDIDALGGQEINCLAELYDNLIVGLTDSLYRISFVAGADTFQVSKITDDIGCIAKNSMQSITLTNAQNGLVFLDKDRKVYFFNGVAVQDISTLITQAMAGFSTSRLQYAVSADTNTSYYLCLTASGGSANNRCLEFQYQIGEWTRHTQIPTNALAHVLDNNGRDQVYAGSYDAFVYQLDDSSLTNDVATETITGIITVVNTINTATASGLQVIYTSNGNYTAGTLEGAPITLTAGAGSGETNVIYDTTTTGIIVVDDFTTTPNVTTSFEIGAINASYTTKWYDLGQPARIKHLWKMNFWAQDEPTASGIDVTYATDFSSDIATQTVSLDSVTSDALWGSAVWGVSLWGGGSNDVFREVKTDGKGRYLRVRWDEDDPTQGFTLYNFQVLTRPGDVN